MSKQKTFTIGVTNNISWLALLAKELNYFKEIDAKVEFRRFTVAKEQLKALQKGWVDFAHLLDVNVAYLGFERKPAVKLITCVEQKQDAAILARADRNIQNPTDLKNKTIAYLPRTSSHMFLVKLLEKFNMNLTDVNLVECPPETMINKLIDGKVDAISVWSHHLVKAHYQLAEKGVSAHKFAGKDIYTFSIVLAASEKVLDKHQAVAQEVVLALKKAEEFVQQNPNEAQKILASLVSLEGHLFQEIFENFNPKIMPISESFIKNIEDYSQWIRAKESKFTGLETPDYQDLIDKKTVAYYTEN